MREDTGSSGSVQKAAALLELLSQQDELTIADIAARTNQPRSSVYRLVKSLKEVGYVESGIERGRIRLGKDIFQLARAAGRQYDIRRTSAPILRRLLEEVGVSVFLCVREGYSVRCLASELGEGADLLTMRTGMLMPLHLGAAAKVLLAYSGPGFWERYNTQVDLGEGGTPHEMKGSLARRVAPHLHELEREMEEIRQNGVSASNSDVVIGVSSLGMPIRDRNGSVVAAVSIGGPTAWVNGAEHRAANLAALRRASYELSMALGYDGGPSLSSPTFPRTPDMGSVVEVALVTPNIEAALVKHSVAAPRHDRVVLELGPKQMSGSFYRGRAAESTVLYSPAPSPRSLSLVSPVSGPSIHRDWLERFGEGVHQITVAVASLEQSLQAMVRRGAEVIEHAHGVSVGPYDEWACLDSVAELGYFLRLVQPKPGSAEQKRP